MKYKCIYCGTEESIIKVGHSDGQSIYSCTNETVKDGYYVCPMYAQILVMMDEGVFVDHRTLLETFKKVANEQD